MDGSGAVSMDTTPPRGGQGRAEPSEGQVEGVEGIEGIESQRWSSTGCSTGLCGVPQSLQPNSEQAPAG